MFGTNDGIKFIENNLPSNDDTSGLLATVPINPFTRLSSPPLSNGKPSNQLFLRHTTFSPYSGN